MPRDRSLPIQPVAGDRVKLKAERITEYQQASKLAGWDDFDAYATREVTRVDPWASGGGSRLYIEGPPFMFLPRDVNLTLGDKERAAMLLARGWSYDKKEDKWRAP